MKTAILLAGLTVVAATALGLSACSNAVKDPKYERNPDPKRKYVVTAKVDGAPGPFRDAVAGVQYRIGPDRACMPPAEPISGTFPTQSRAQVEAKVRKESGSEFEFDVYLDAMLAKDYFGRGVCNWQVEIASLSLRPTGAESERKFDVSFSGSALEAGRPLVLYARREMYAVPFEDSYDAFETAIEKEHAQARYGSDPSKFFTITLSARESGHDY
ncbi:hypothetical protein [Lysobacter enzymogenes]|uniref:hypothetical protein n=1 Tax=Lysobacter enzymogenes TaxID=69 RepID=UPI00099E166B|nr:hypothetical protein [Lysobacter enzymogenes]QQQ00634.1 hypothetical protein JHW41_21555 [Lysobacter enzymogenes]UZW60079.1 hypothetical protein BV903_022860 [Lysobacter enzymogenes]